MRIAVAGFQHESNTFARSATRRAQFVEDCLLFGDDVPARWRNAHHEIGGFFEGCAEAGFEAAPLVMGKATPSGPVDHAFVEEIAGEIVRRWRDSGADGLLLALHGAMVTTAEPSGDTVVLRAVREALGPSIPIVVTLDFHGNCTEEMARLADAILFYQTNPHTDMRETGLRAARLMARMVRGEVGPACALRKPPLIIPINHQSTADEPLRGLLERAREIERRPGMLAVSLAAGFPYADVPEMGPAVLAIADGDAESARRAADELAEKLWESREALAIDLPEAPTAVEAAMGDPNPPVVLVDFGDNVGGGSAADGTVLLAELVRRDATRSVVTIADPEAVRECVAAGVRSPITLSVGGKTDRLHGSPVTLRGKVRGIHDGTWVEPEARHGGVRFNDQGITAVVKWGKDNLVCLTSRRYPPFSLGQITSLGIDPRRQQVLVVKAAIAYKAAYLPIAGRVIEVDTPGLTAVNPAHFRYTRIRRPMWPLDSDRSVS